MATLEAPSWSNARLHVSLLASESCFQLELPFPLAEVSASVVGGRIQFERGVVVLGCELSGEWGENGRGRIEGMLQSSGYCSQLFLILRDAGGCGFHELGD